MPELAPATDQYILEKLEVIIAEYTCGFVGAIPEQDDRDRARKIMLILEADLRD